MAIVATAFEQTPPTDLGVATDHDALHGAEVPTAEEVPNVPTGIDTVASAKVAAVCASDVERPVVAKPSTKPPGKTMGRSSCEAHRPFIEAEVEKGRNAVAIYQDLVEHHGFDGAYNAVKRFVRKLVSTERKVICRFETEPGAEAQVDYGEGAPTLHPQTAKYRKPRYL